MKPFPLLLLWGLLALVNGASAAVDLFSAQVPVADESPQVRQQAVKAALRQVLVKASGRPLPTGHPALDESLAEAESLVEAFRYLPLETAEGAGRALWVRFDRKGVAGILDKLGRPLWEGDRPELLLWLAVDEGGRRRLADEEHDAALLDAAVAAAEVRGMTLVLPLMDLQDRNGLRAADIWAGDLERIRQASARYGGALPLVGRLHRLADLWRGEWWLLLPEQTPEFSRSHRQATEALARGVARAVALTAERFAPRDDGEEGAVVVRFLGVEGLKGYARLKGLLDALSGARWRPLSLADGKVLVEIRMRGGQAAVEARLAGEAVLTPSVEMPGDEKGTSAALSYLFH